jgi:hypothetical protein
MGMIRETTIGFSAEAKSERRYGNDLLSEHERWQDEFEESIRELERRCQGTQLMS